MQNRISSEKLKILSGSALKLIAILSMLIDHAALILYPEVSFLALPILGEKITLFFLMRTVGRLALPIFCFLAVEGVLHTRNLRKYILSLFLFAVISEIPFNFMINGSLLFPAKQNIYFTLLLGILLIYIFKSIESELKKALLMILTAVVTILLRVDYGLNGVLLIFLLYILRDFPAAKTILSYPLLSGGPAAFCAFVPINMYNGKRGFIKSPALKYAFYLFYPLHITLLLIIKHIL